MNRLITKGLADLYAELAESKPRLGSGERFKKLTRSLSRKGVHNPKALAASIGRKKWGKKKFQSLSAHGRK